MRLLFPFPRHINISLMHNNMLFIIAVDKITGILYVVFLFLSFLGPLAKNKQDIKRNIDQLIPPLCFCN